MASSPNRAPLIDRRKGLIFNLLCGAYFWAVSPHVVTATRSGIAHGNDEGTPVLWLGGLLALLMVLEVRALPEKMKFVHFAIRERQQGDGSPASSFVLWMFHSVISILILFHAAGQFGIDVFPKEETSNPPVWLLALIPVVVIKELYLLFAIWMTKGNELRAEHYARPNRRETFHDLVLVIYACLAYSVTWGTISGEPLDPGNPVMMIVNGFAASLLFLIFYLPMRIPYLLEESALIQTPGDRFRFVASLLLALIPALWSLT